MSEFRGDPQKIGIGIDRVRGPDQRFHDVETRWLDDDSRAFYIDGRLVHYVVPGSGSYDFYRDGSVYMSDLISGTEISYTTDHVPDEIVALRSDLQDAYVDPTELSETA